MSVRSELDAAWVAWQQSELYKKWRRLNPGEAAKLDAYRAGGVRPVLVTATGRALVAETAAWLLTAPVVEPPPPPPGVVLELDGGTYTGSQYASLLAAAPTALTVRPKPGASVSVLGGASVRDNLRTEGIRFDGEGKTANTWMTDVAGWAFVGCRFVRFYEAGVPGSHSEALYVGGGCSNGLIYQCTFDDNGTTAHIFFTWFGSSQNGGAYDQGNYPRDICVRRCSFSNSRNGYYSIQSRSEIPDASGINVDPGNVSDVVLVDRPAFLRACG